MGKKKRAVLDVPAPPSSLQDLITRERLPVGKAFHRVHSDAFGSVQFNPGDKGNARFSPISDATGRRIPTIYAGNTFDCALMESVFHDVPFQAGMKTHDKSKLLGQLHSQITFRSQIIVASLSNTALRKLGVQRGQLIDTEKDTYPRTRKWAEAIHAACADVQGLSWISRQDDRAMAVVLFEDRISAGVINQHGSSRNILGDPHAYEQVLKLADRIGVKIVNGTA